MGRPLEQELRELLKSERADPAPTSPDEMFMFLITRIGWANRPRPPRSVTRIPPWLVAASELAIAGHSW